MSRKYKEEKTIKSLVHNNITPLDNNKKINLVIYYKNNKMKNLLMKNHPRPNEDLLKECMVVYRFTCPIQGCPGSHIGMTTMRLIKRISCHIQEGVIFRHYKPSPDTLLECIEISGRADSDLRLCLKEALFIEKEKSTLNTTDEVKILPASMMRPTRQPDIKRRIPSQHPIRMLHLLNLFVILLCFIVTLYRPVPRGGGRSNDPPKKKIFLEVHIFCDYPFHWTVLTK